jgi:hypothetical protein
LVEGSSVDLSEIMKLIIVALAIAGGVAGAGAGALTVQITAPQVSPPLSFKMGEPRRPDGAMLTLDELRVAILPLRKDAPIYMANEARPDFGEKRSVVALNSVEVVPRYKVELKACN